MVTTYFKNCIANLVWHTAAEAALPDTYYLALSSTEPLEDGSGVLEPSASSGYTRIALSGLTEAVDGQVTNSATLTWPEITSNEGTVAYWAMFDAPTGGNLLMGNDIDLKHLDAGTEMRLRPEQLILRVLGLE